MASNDSGGCCGRKGISRRTAVRGLAQASAFATLAKAMPVMAGPFDEQPTGGKYHVPKDKKLTRAWVAALTERGEPTRYRGWEQLRYIGMPIGGIATGTVYLGGDGTLWCWDIFNAVHQGVVPNAGVDGYTSSIGAPLTARDGANFVKPPVQRSPWEFEQGFAVAVLENGRKNWHRLDHTGFADVSFTGQPPIGLVDYADPATPLRVSLEAMTPYSPLDADESSYPATILRYSLHNTSGAPMDVEIHGWLENPVLRNKPEGLPGTPVNRMIGGTGWQGFSAEVTGWDSDSELASAPDMGSIALIALDHAEVDCAADSHGLPIAARQHASGGDPRPIGTVSVSARLKPGETRHVDYVIGWFFPNSTILMPSVHGKEASPPGRQQRWYGTRFASAGDVAAKVAEHIDPLRATTRAWRDAWYGGTLPHWLLERTIIPANCLQTSTCLRFANGRFWGWEGVGCCPGTCTHVWLYAQSSGHLFPALERDVRERTDLGVAMHPNGEIGFRGEFNTKREGSVGAVDGQAGVILRTLREHRMTGDDAFLDRVYPELKKAMQYLIGVDERDGPADGILAGRQYNTLDAAWFGKVPNLSSLYLSSLRAAEQLALEAGDVSFAKRCASIAQRGYRNFMELYRPQFGYFVQEEDPKHPQAIGIGIGCYIDQVIGQWWSHELGLQRITDGKAVRSALHQIWLNNFVPDMGRFRASITDPRMKGRPYSLAGNAGLIMCAWPHGGREADWESHWQYSYFNETMTGFEYEVAANMIWESQEDPDLLVKGLAITRAIHDRYNAVLRNPYNEVECSDHYARAMASHGVFTALCGFEYDGPNGHIGFKPRLTDGPRFKAPFTAASGWGTFAQTVHDRHVETRLTVLRGKLELRSFGLQVPPRARVRSVNSTAGPVQFEQTGRDILVKLKEPALANPDRPLGLSLEI